MSTTFGVKIDKDMYLSDCYYDDELDITYVKVAFRSNGVRWLNALAPLLPNDTKVIAMDNSQQGIYTILDLKLYIKDYTVTIKDIEDIRLKFDFNGKTMVEYFNVVLGNAFATIRSRLNHADDETKSPYFYEETVIGDDCTNIAITNFVKWYNTLKYD